MSAVASIPLQPSRPHTSAARPAVSAIDLPSPRRGEFWRHPRRFLWSRLRMMFGQTLSVRWGLDRGALPAHRHYINLFLNEFSGDMRGVCLEFEDCNYLRRFGGAAALRCDVLHMDDSNPRATIIGDITQPDDVPADTYDCIVCTHVLHVISDLMAAARGLHRMLRPGGVLLCAVPHISVCDEREGELWRFTRLGLEQALAGAFGREHITTRAYGNSLVAAGEMRGLSADEFTWRELHTHDPCSPVEICARAVKRL